MTQFKLIDHGKDNERTFESKSEAEDSKQELIGLGADSKALEIKAINSQGPEVVEKTKTPDEVVEESVETVESHLPEEPPLEDDPVDWMPEHFVDTIQGVPVLNRKGYAVMAERYNVSVVAEPVVRASETDFTYAEFRAIAEKDGVEYSGFGSAHVDRGDGDDEHLLNELAETRAMKRSVTWATGVGMSAREELE